MLPGIVQAQRSSGPTKSLCKALGGKDFIKNHQVAPFHSAQFLKDFKDEVKIFTRKQGKNILICLQQWGMIGYQSRDLFPSWILSLHRVSIPLLFCHKGWIWDTKSSNSLRKLLVAQHEAKIQLFHANLHRLGSWRRGGVWGEFTQCWLCSAADSTSSTNWPKKASLI